MSDDKLFDSEERGFIEIFFTPEELISAIEILTLAKRLCSAIVSTHAAGGSDLPQEQIDKFSTNAAIAEALAEKLTLDSEVGQPDPENIN